MFLSAALPHSLLGSTGTPDIDRDASSKALVEALALTARDAFPGTDVEIVWTGGEAIRARFYAERPGSRTFAPEDCLAELLQIHAHVPKLHERLERVWGALIQHGAWRRPTPNPLH